MASPWDDEQDSLEREPWESDPDAWRGGDSESTTESAFTDDENWWCDDEEAPCSPVSGHGLELDQIYRFTGGGVVASGIEVFDSHKVDDLTFFSGQYIGYVEPGEVYRPHGDRLVILGDPKLGTFLFRGMPDDKDFSKMEFYFGIVPHKGATQIVPLEE